MLRLVKPDRDFRDAIIDFREEFENQGVPMHGTGQLEIIRDVDMWMERNLSYERKENLPPGYEPAELFLCIREEDRTPVGMIQLRHCLNRDLEDFGGHIGYCIRPCEQGKGYATDMLRLCLEHCRRRCMERVLIVCEQENAKSRKVILKNGGVYEDSRQNPNTGKTVERYWITIPSPFETVLPGEIEKRSFEIITEELGHREFDPLEEPIIKRCIHTSADFDYAHQLYFSQGAVEQALEAVGRGADFITDTQMGKAGINKAALEALGCRAFCFMSDEEVAAQAKEKGTTRATAAVQKVARMEQENGGRPLILAVGNAPTALVEIHRLIQEGRLHPALLIAVPVGFVNVVPAKELVMTDPVPCIVARGRKGGSNVAAAICNALLYMKQGRKL